MSSPWESLIPGGLTGLPGAERRHEEVFTATGSYVVNHGLANEPLVQVFDSNGTILFVNVTHQSENTVLLEFGGTLTDARVVCIA